MTRLKDRIQLEAHAILALLDKVAANEIEWRTSTVVDDEILAIKDNDRRNALTAFCTMARSPMQLNEKIETRAGVLTTMGFHIMDALHLACAEAANVSVFLTTDDRLLRRATRNARSLSVAVANPTTWTAEE